MKKKHNKNILLYCNIINITIEKSNKPKFRAWKDQGKRMGDGGEGFHIVLFKKVKISKYLKELRYFYLCTYIKKDMPGRKYQ